MRFSAIVALVPTVRPTRPNGVKRAAPRRAADNASDRLRLSVAAFLGLGMFAAACGPATTAPSGGAPTAAPAAQATQPPV